MISAANARTQEIHVVDSVKRGYVRKPAILFSGNLSESMKALAGDNYELLKIKRVAEDHLLVRDQLGQERRLAETPLQLAGVMAFDQNDRELVDRTTEWLQKRRAVTVPPPHILSADDSTAFAAAILASANQLAVKNAELTTTLFRQLAEARQANEDLQNRFAALEAFIDRHGLQPFELAFINPPIVDDTEPNVLAAASEARISQILPVASAGVSAIALHISKPAPRSEAILTLALSSIEDGRLIESWSVPAAEIDAGWMTLSLKSTIAGLRRTLRLTVSVDGQQVDLPTLSLGNAQPLELFRLQDPDLRQSISGSSLALQVYVGLPGVVPPNRAGFSVRAAQDNNPQGLRETSLAPEVLAQTRQVHLDEGSSGFDGVTYLDDDHIVSCHPPAFGTTIAKIAGGCPVGTLRLSANLLVAHEKARDVEFSLVTSRDETRVISLLSGTADPDSGEGFSGWVRVPAKQPRFASLYLDTASHDASDLYLATRMVDPGNHDFAWARFLNIHALVQG